MDEHDALVIGGGPAGLAAAEALARAGRRVVVAEAKPSIGRKFLMAGKSGLNLTKDEPFEAFVAAYAEAAPALRPMLEAFGPAEVKAWAEALGQPVFTGSSGRVFPEAMKASPLLRAWLRRLDGLGVTLRTRWRWTGWDAAFQFDTPEGPVSLRPDRCVLALGGASWARLGSDGRWADLFPARGLPVAPFRPANAGLVVPWSPHMDKVLGQPLKNIRLVAGSEEVRGEAVISSRGLEGGGIYAISRAVREGADLALDLAPGLSAEEVTRRIAAPRGKQSYANHLRKALRLDPAKLAILREFAGPLSNFPEVLAQQVKALHVPHAGLRPLDEAISTAGGVPFSALDAGLQLRNAPGTWCAGEMLDWEAPTGGYLLTGCLATGYWAGQAAAG
ncbi:TIGR03862 family flavoprotein [Mesobacterium pallidum]|uniref:TIGR03862 family flavoprotein n=1 Tax=Mesobacterium pallidum TaxID=2872037 RepID=UPI001EE34FF5|nr:TIGR03862 family flavoprotein [Mesobacterium pallidum]